MCHAELVEAWQEDKIEFTAEIAENTQILSFGRLRINSAKDLVLFVFISGGGKGEGFMLFFTDYERSAG